eukprot:g659.t1
MLAGGRNNVKTESATSAYYRNRDRVGESLREIWSKISPRTRKDLVFRQYPKRTGWGLTLGCFVTLNVGVFAMWQVAESDVRVKDRMVLMFAQEDNSLEKGHIWSLFTPSFSHMGLGHIFGNGVIFLYLGRKLHELLGRTKFVALYFAGAAAGTIATDLAYRFGNLGIGGESCAQPWKAYMKILGSERPDQQLSIGASDAIMAMVGFFYCAFPRTSIHIFPSWGLLDRRLAEAKNPGFFRRIFHRLVWVRGGTLRVSAVWILPTYFFFDLLAFYSDAVGVRRGAGDNTNHAAHLGGLAAGIACYAFFGRSLKKQYAPHLLFENDPRRWYLMGLTALVAAMYWKFTNVQRERENEKMETLLSKIRDERKKKEEEERRRTGNLFGLLAGSLSSLPTSPAEQNKIIVRVPSGVACLKVKKYMIDDLPESLHSEDAQTKSLNEWLQDSAIPIKPCPSDRDARYVVASQIVGAMTKACECSEAEAAQIALRKSGLIDEDDPSSGWVDVPENKSTGQARHLYHRDTEAVSWDDPARSSNRRCDALFAAVVSIIENNVLEGPDHQNQCYKCAQEVKSRLDLKPIVLQATFSADDPALGLFR